MGLYRAFQVSDQQFLSIFAHLVCLSSSAPACPLPFSLSASQIVVVVFSVVFSICPLYYIPCSLAAYLLLFPGSLCLFHCLPLCQLLRHISHRPSQHQSPKNFNKTKNMQPNSLSLWAYLRPEGWQKCISAAGVCVMPSREREAPEFRLSNWRYEITALSIRMYSTFWRWSGPRSSIEFDWQKVTRTEENKKCAWGSLLGFLWQLK